MHLTTKSGVTGSIPQFFGLSDETLNQGFPSPYDVCVVGTLNLRSLTH